MSSRNDLPAACSRRDPAARAAAVFTNYSPPRAGSGSLPSPSFKSTPTTGALRGSVELIMRSSQSVRAVTVLSYICIAFTDVGRGGQLAPTTAKPHELEETRTDSPRPV
eukprot:451759-Pyramimonas_sp.AAC.1